MFYLTRKILNKSEKLNTDTNTIYRKEKYKERNISRQIQK